VFEEIPGKKFGNFTEVRDGINMCTDKVAGAKKGIVDKPIILNIFSHTCPDLTLIDLPGITRIPLAGSDQPNNIEQITRSMANRYVSDPRTIILCVISANADISTSDGL
jgi:dynamin 1-like protein